MPYHSKDVVYNYSVMDSMTIEKPETNIRAQWKGCTKKDAKTKGRKDKRMQRQKGGVRGLG